MSIEFPDSYLAELWNTIDWSDVEEKLAIIQEKLSIAAFRRDDNAIRQLQIKIVRDPDFKCLAVRHVTESTSSPGIDGVRWRTAAEKMRAALSLTSKDYHAMPLRQILIVAKNTGKERRTGLPTYYDRAMNVLYGYSLIPVTEAVAERKSFAFRPCRSANDAHAYIMEALKGNDAPGIVVRADIKAYYATIQHSWLLEHAPMDKRVLSEFLNAGIVFAGELFPADGMGISEGANISPYLGNFVLDGLQKYIYQRLYDGRVPTDYSNGNLTRFADDVLITVRSQQDAERVLEILSEFLTERGLRLSAEKTVIARVEDGFTFLSRTYIRKDNLIYCYPSEKAVQRFISELQSTISTSRKSQRALILTLNKKMKGWAEYHRYSDAEAAFRRVDEAVQAALLESALAKHPKKSKDWVLERYWYKESNGRHCYAVLDDKSTRLVRLADTILLEHSRIKTNANPFVERDYVEARTHERAIRNVTGPYRAVWARQGGLCYYCGRPILRDQPRTVVALHLNRPPSVKNTAYIHKLCAQNEFEMIHTMEDLGSMRPYDVLQALEGVARARIPNQRIKGEIGPGWRHFRFKEYMAVCTASSVTLTFREIEKINGKPLPVSARKNRDWWYPRTNCNMIAEAWLTEGYTLHSLNLEKEKITLHRNMEGYSKLDVPSVLTVGKIPDNAKFELETHMKYIIQKYGLG